MYCIRQKNVCDLSLGPKFSYHAQTSPHGDIATRIDPGLVESFKNVHTTARGSLGITSATCTFTAVAAPSHRPELWLSPSLVTHLALFRS